MPSIVRANFDRLFAKNLPALQQKTGLQRSDLINVYTSFVSIYVLSQLENPDFLKAHKLQDLGEIHVEMIKKASHVLKFQCNEVVTQIFEIMTKTAQPHNDPNKIGWDRFCELISVVIPSSLEDKMDLFLCSFVPKNYEGRPQDYEFSQDEILGCCRSCLAVLFREHHDVFFHEITENYAKIIYQILKLKWSDDPAEQMSVPLKRLKKTICEADGYERDMLSLLYGAVGLMSLNHRGEVLQEGKLKLERDDVSATTSSLKTILMQNQQTMSATQMSEATPGARFEKS